MPVSSWAKGVICYLFKGTLVSGVQNGLEGQECVQLVTSAQTYR